MTFQTSSKSRKLSPDNKWCKLLDRIRDKRNNVIHKGSAITASQIRSMWADDGLFPVKYPETPEVVKDLMMDVLKEVGNPPNLDQLLLPSLYRWSLCILKDAT